MSSYDITKIDKNYITQSTLTRKNIVYYDVNREPFKVYGLIPPKDEKDCFRRIPLEIASKVSEGVEALHTNTAGGRVRFATNSSYIAIRAEMDNIPAFSHMPLSGIAGFDLYRKENGYERYLGCFIPPYDVRSSKVFESDLYEPEVYPKDLGMQEYTINFPLYCDVKKLYVVLEEGASVQTPSSYDMEKPIVFYGSSITQGGCASRPGNCYESIISRRMNFDYINLGFSGQAKGETEMAEYIADLPMAAFVYDYDHNAPTTEHLINTYESFFKTIREKNPLLPIICISRPYGYYQQSVRERRDIIKKNVEKWRAEGDNNVYFIDGNSFKEMFHAGESIVVDNNHPNDLGFWCMAEVIGNELENILHIRSNAK